MQEVQDFNPDRTRETLGNINTVSEKNFIGREQTAKEALERKIEQMERKLQDFRALYRSLPDEMNFEASRAMRHMIDSL